MPQKYLYGPGVHIRHDWRMWIRHDFARWIKPGVDPADMIPGLARERAQKDAAMERARAPQDAELAAEIEHERRVLAVLNEEMKEVNAEMARWRRRLAEEEAKYSPSQPRVPAGSGEGNGRIEVAAAAVSRHRRTSRNRWATSMSATLPGPARRAIYFRSSQRTRARTASRFQAT
jgi:hypothetical protein